MSPPARCLAISVALVMLLAGCGGGNINTELALAARQGRIQTIQALLDAGADPDEPSGGNGWTPLMHAIHKNQKKAVIALLDGGASINAQTGSGLSALIMAAGCGQSETVRELLTRGADPCLGTKDGYTALAAAVGGVSDIDRFTLGSCQTDTVRALLEAAPDLELKGNLPGMAAYWLARLGGCSEVIQLIDR